MEFFLLIQSALQSIFLQLIFGGRHSSTVYLCSHWILPLLSIEFLVYLCPLLQFNSLCRSNNFHSLLIVCVPWLTFLIEELFLRRKSPLFHIYSACTLVIYSAKWMMFSASFMFVFDLYVYQSFVSSFCKYKAHVCFNSIFWLLALFVYSLFQGGEVILCGECSLHLLLWLLWYVLLWAGARVGNVGILALVASLFGIYRGVNSGFFCSFLFVFPSTNMFIILLFLLKWSGRLLISRNVAHGHNWCYWWSSR